ncbi:NolY [Bradyrhizobium diazoefficiens USDA 110]|jgi:hypothetical protein|uniref:NolY n=2 Tax=Bradyrhizobium TaxID=374 RepID=H7C6U1_BRADU|nr:NolY [Bradyrhizobium japonicum]AAG60987.1 NolY [Bradyrhizobium japonicum]PDT56364.1 hypothetical protein CO678_38820 [Bradyrhizobium diazoefficiens]QBP20855.1 hypothetical protein Bdiaspc4_10235 [Bradyrhizobium diazoefficiens]BAC47281.1 NolY [Bradyrhizobium diazoefficiens USDA 110]
MPPQRRTRAGELAFAGVRAGPFALTRRVASTVRRCCRGSKQSSTISCVAPNRVTAVAERTGRLENPFKSRAIGNAFRFSLDAHCTFAILAAVICPAKRPPFGERETIPLLRLSCISPLWRNTVELDPSNSRIQNLEDRVDLQLDIVAGLMREEGNELEAIRLLNALIGQMITAELELGQLGDTRTGHGRMRLSQDRGVYHPEDLQILGRLFDQTVAALPAALRTSANRLTIAKLILSRAAAD